MDPHNLAVVFGPNLLAAPPYQDLQAALVEGKFIQVRAFFRLR